jgi:anti-anti-sigma factor
MAGFSATRTGRGLVLRSLEALSEETISTLQRVLLTPDRSTRFILLDLTRAEYADAAGLRWLLQLREALEERRTGLRVLVPRKSRIRRALALTGYDRFLDLYDSARAAWMGVKR